MRPHAVAILLCILAAGLSGQPKINLDLRGDPASAWEIPGDFRVLPFAFEERSGGGIGKAPFHCSECASAGRFADGAETPAAPAELLRQPRAVIEAFGAREHKLKPIVLSMDRAVLIVYLGESEGRHAGADERAGLEQQFGKKPGRRITPHERAHLYAMRYLACEARWCELLGVAPAGIGRVEGQTIARAEYYLFEKLDAYREFGRHFFGMFGPDLSWWWHEQSHSLTGSLNGDGLADDALSARFSYLVAHILTYQQFGFFYRVPSFIPAGLGHWAERSHRNRQDTFMVMGTPSANKEEWGWKAPDWDRAVRDMVNTGKSKPFIAMGLIDMDDQLTPPYRAQAWSMVKYLAGVDRGQFGQFLRIALNKRRSETAIEALARAADTAYGATLPELEAAWREWVLTGQRARR